MASTITPTLPTYSTQFTAASFSTSTTPGTTTTLDLTTKKGAYFFCRIGRNAATALTNPAYIAIRRQLSNASTNNVTTGGSGTNYDFISSTAAVNATTISANSSAGDHYVALTSTTGFGAYQNCCLNSSGLRIEFFTVTGVSTNLYIDRSGGFLIAHTSADTITNGADFGTVWVPGGYIYEITPVNNSGQTVIMACDVEVDASDSVAP